MDEAGDAKADDDGDGRGDEIEANRLETDAAEFLRVTQARHADDEGAEDNGDDHHLDEVDEDRADWCNPPVDEWQADSPTMRPTMTDKIRDIKILIERFIVITPF